MEVTTLGDAYALSVSIRMRCAYGPMRGLVRERECEFGTILDTMTLLATRGRDFPLDMLAERLRCPRCGSRRVRVMFVVPKNVNTEATFVRKRG